eukprot:TRINITY_DN65741_c0_g1_i1.p2 TRINITY_DN65741_c0_g1~~TRINITY_DN65741_c0_g1_i1.p2  ORF type:complete len:389 (+),score=101.16 TRINITY_DN65741_c0_g1_i1:107-1273(+)
MGDYRAVEQTTMGQSGESQLSATGHALRIGALIALGILEGFVLERSHVPAPEVIYDQMIFRRMAVMKLFLTALGASMLCQAGMSLWNKEQFEQSRFYRYKVSGLLRVASGCIILGIGMTLCGSGPSMLPAQFFVAKGGWRILLGCLAGGLVFAVLDSVLPLKARRELATPEEATVLEQHIGGSYTRWAFLFGGTLMICSVALELIFPFDGCPAELGDAQSGPRCHEPIAGVRHAWPPTIAGLVIGLNQVPLRIITSDGQGGSTWFMNFIATITLDKLPSTRGMAWNKLSNCYQFIYAIGGVAVGGLISALIYDDVMEFPSFHWARDLCGGFCIIFGARIASGCTCGHGISGSSELAVESIIGTACIFGSAIATGMIIEYAILGHPAGV